MSDDLSGKVSIITGASSGIGQATAVMFARKGAMVTLCGRDEDRLKAVLDECVQASGGHRDRFITVRGDLTEAKVREDTVAKTVEKFGRLDILVPNAGTYREAGTLADATEETFDDLFNTNVKSVFFLIQAAAPHLAETKGNVVSVSSMAGQMASGKLVLYPMTKAAVDHMTRCLALDLGPRGVRVNAVNPSHVPTRIRRDFRGDLDEVVRRKGAVEVTKQPMGRCGTADEVAAVICFLASDAAAGFITGQCLLVDGGRTLAGPLDTWSSQRVESW